MRVLSLFCFKVAQTRVDVLDFCDLSPGDVARSMVSFSINSFTNTILKTFTNILLLTNTFVSYSQKLQKM